jgi:hypothetical protein
VGLTSRTGLLLVYLDFGGDLVSDTAHIAIE